MPRLNSRVGNAALSVGHMAGMIDMVALPLWVGVLMRDYHYRPQEAGIVVTVFLTGAVLASLTFASKFTRLPQRLMAFSGFAASATCFSVVAFQPIDALGIPLVAALHLAAGFGTGTALSMTHGLIGRTRNPHRLFGIVNTALGVLGIVFFATIPAIMGQYGPSALFKFFAITMSIAALVAGLSFPTIDRAETARHASVAKSAGRFPAAAWYVIGVVIMLALNQAMVFSFVERIGAWRGYAAGNVNTVLVVMGFINLVPGVVAALLQKRLSPLVVGMAGPVVQALLAIVVSNATTFPLYAVAASVYVSLVIFTHTFMFGLLSKLDPSGRAVAATPAMMMLGACIGPGLGGLVVATIGYNGLGWAAAIFSCIAVALMLQVKQQVAKHPTEAIGAKA